MKIWDAEFFSLLVHKRLTNARLPHVIPSLSPDL